MCAAIAAEWFGNFAEAADAMSGNVVAVSEPQPGAVERYGELFDLYRQVYERLKPLYARLDYFAGTAG